MHLTNDGLIAYIVMAKSINYSVNRYPAPSPAFYNMSIGYFSLLPEFSENNTGEKEARRR